MRNRLSIILLGRSGSKVRQLHISARQMTFALLAGLLCAVVGLCLCVDYLLLRLHRADQKKLDLKIQEVTAQRDQVQKLAEQIGQIKERLMTIKGFEERVRTLIELNPAQMGEVPLGVGGSALGEGKVPVGPRPSVEIVIQQTQQRVKELDDLSQQQQCAFADMLDQLEGHNNLLACTPAIRPAKGWLTSTFGHRDSPFTGEQELHKGIDIANHPGTPIMAAAAGEISFVGDNDSWGGFLVIDHGYGLTTRYAHLQKFLRKAGDHVHRGEVIALMGDSGRTTGPHLHYEVRVNGVPVPPEKYILN